MSSQSLPPFCSFPPDLRDVVEGGLYLVNGGFEFDGKLITDVDEEEIIKVLKQIEKDGVKHVAISGILFFCFFFIFLQRL